MAVVEMWPTGSAAWAMVDGGAGTGGLLPAARAFHGILAGMVLASAALRRPGFGHQHHHRLARGACGDLVLATPPVASVHARFLPYPAQHRVRRPAPRRTRCWMPSPATIMLPARGNCAGSSLHAATVLVPRCHVRDHGWCVTGAAPVDVAGFFMVVLEPLRRPPAPGA